MATCAQLSLIVCPVFMKFNLQRLPWMTRGSIQKADGIADFMDLPKTEGNKFIRWLPRRVVLREFMALIWR